VHKSTPMSKQPNPSRMAYKTITGALADQLAHRESDSQTFCVAA
jgi:hypothetical protein